MKEAGLANSLFSYDPKTDPEVLKRKEEETSLNTCSQRRKGKKGAATTRRRAGGTSPITRPPKKPKTSGEDYGIPIPSMVEFAAVLRFREAALELTRELEADPIFQRLQEKLEKAKARNCELDGDFFDRNDKLTYWRDQRIPELIEENRCLRAQISSLATTDIQIKSCEVQLG